ncbi:TPA: hypothetical protein PXP51_002267 [Yersinia enterocolitica]|nr:hypothetical protein [Yersinia enterocolitica]
METNIEIYLQALQALKEDDLSEQIIKPLFESMGCYRVDFHGGPYEKGKDIIAYLKAPLEDHIIVIQTKKIGDGKATTDKNIIGSLIFQLQQCYLKDIPLHNGETKKPDAVYLATPFKINSRLLDEIHGHLNGMGNKLKLLDGPLLVSKIKEHNPTLFNRIMGVDRKVLVQDTYQLKNIELMKALNTEYSIGEIHCYNDLAFFMGDVDSHYLLKGSFHINPAELSINRDGWENLKKRYLYKLEEILEFWPLTEKNNSIEERYSLQLKQHQSVENIERQQEIFVAKNEITLLENTLSSIRSELNTFIEQRERSKSNNTNLDKAIHIWWPIISQANKTSEYLKINSEFYETLCDSKEHKEIPKAYTVNFEDYLTTLKSLSDEWIKLTTLEREFIPTPTFTYKFCAIKIEEWINSHSEFYISAITKLNSESVKNNDYLRSFLANTQKTLSVLELLKDLSSEATSIISFTKSLTSIRDGISISPFSLFDTHYDIAVYGGAGAGKTTTLQMYTKKIIDEGTVNIIYLPLNRLINRQDINIKIESDSLISYKQIISLILISKEITDTDENIEKLDISLTTNNGLKLVIDGLDEAYSTVPFIIDSINSFKSRHPHIQLIVSSRDCVSFIHKINFLGVTLLPFTTEQLYAFINSWFSDNPSESTSLIDDIENNDLVEIIKTPLLATLLCILKKRGIGTPSTEMEIFTRRLKLFCGEYDNYKTIKRTTSDSIMLEKAAMKIAYQLHIRNKRTASKETINEYLKNDISFYYGENTSEMIVNELINPCNILHYDSLTDTYSFGHLRFQEHLAALELKDNRGRDILPLLSKDWWRGTLCLYAQACEFSNLLEDFFKQYGQVSSALNTLREMAKYRPIKERHSLIQLINQYEKTEDLDGYTNDGWDDADDWRYVKDTSR